MRKGLFNYIAHDCRDNNRTGDLVECCNCGDLMLVNLGAEDCPLCGKEDCLKWADENYHEWDGTEENLTLF